MADEIGNNMNERNLFFIQYYKCFNIFYKLLYT